MYAATRLRRMNDHEISCMNMNDFDDDKRQQKTCHIVHNSVSNDKRD